MKINNLIEYHKHKINDENWIIHQAKANIKFHKDKLRELTRKGRK